MKTRRNLARKVWLVVLGLCPLVFALVGVKSRAAEPEAKKPGEREQIVVEQGTVADKFKQLERSLDKLASDIEAKDPRRAALLKQAFKMSRDKDLNGRLENLAALLQQDQLFKASKAQVDVQQDLVKLLDLLMSEDRSKQIESDKARIRQYIARIGQLIREQKAIQAQHTNCKT